MIRRNSVTTVALVALVAVFLVPPTAEAHTTTTHPFPGVTHVYKSTAEQNINVVSIDLCAGGTRVRATNQNEAGRTTSSFGKLVGADIAINGDFHQADWSTHGPAAHAGNQWSGQDGTYTGPVAFGDGRADIIGHWDTSGLQPWMQEVVSGHPTIVWNGSVADAHVNPKNSDPLCTNRHPRTAVGLGQNHRTLIMMTVDGRQSGMKGMTCRELAEQMVAHGAYRALNLDGGGSTTMWIRGKGVVNSPSDGQERTVSNHLAAFTPGSGAPPRHCTRYRAAYAGGEGAFAGGTTLNLAPGETATGTLTFRNDGQLPWDASTRLGTTKPRDRESPVATDSWINPARIAAVAETTAPGEIGKFTFTVQAPDKTGTYREHFNLVQEGVTWFSDSGGPPDDKFYFQVVSEAPETEADAGSRDAAAGDTGSATDTSGGASNSGSRPDTETGPSNDAGTGMSSADASSTTTNRSSCGCRSGPAGTTDPVGLVVVCLFVFGYRTRRTRNTA